MEIEFVNHERGFDILSKKYKTLADVLEEQERGERNGKKKVVIVSSESIVSVTKTIRKRRPKNIFYMQALGIAFNHMDYGMAKKFVNAMSDTELKEFVENFGIFY